MSERVEKRTEKMKEFAEKRWQIEIQWVRGFALSLRQLEGVHGAADPAAHLATLKENSPGKSRKKLRVLVRKDQAVATLDSLPDNLRLERGRLTVSFQTSEELAVTLYGIAQILEGELEEFERRYQEVRESNDSISPEKLDLQRLLKELDDIEHK